MRVEPDVKAVARLSYLLPDEFDHVQRNWRRRRWLEVEPRRRARHYMGVAAKSRDERMKRDFKAIPVSAGNGTREIRAPAGWELHGQGAVVDAPGDEGDESLPRLGRDFLVDPWDGSGCPVGVEDLSHIPQHAASQRPQAWRSPARRCSTRSSMRMRRLAVCTASAASDRSP